jgi:hypothetical protein
MKGAWMRPLTNAIAVVLALFGYSSIAAASTLMAVPVVDGSNTGYIGIRQLDNTYPIAADQYWHASGYTVPGDGGGGDFYTGSALHSCASTPNLSGAHWITNMPGIGFSGNSGVVAGMGTESHGHGISSYDMVVNVTTGVSGTVTLATAPTGTDSGATLYFSPDNGGSVIADGESPSHCFYRVSYSYSAKEWGAFENYDPATNTTPNGRDDTIALGNWINANQPHIAVPGSSVIVAPLICNGGGVIQGPPTQAVAESQTAIPQFTIYAPNGSTRFPFSTVSGTIPAMLLMQSQNFSGGPTGCAIHGIGLIADGAGAIDTVHALGTGDLIDGHSYLGNGRYNVSDASTTSNLQIDDSSINDGYAANLYLSSSGVKISRNSVGSAGNGNPSPVGDNIDIMSPSTAPPYASVSDVLISDNIIQQAQGWGLNASNTRFLRAISNYFDDNGKGFPTTTSGIEISNSSVATICGNTVHRNSSGGQQASTPAAPPTTYTPHIHFVGTDDSISLCGNAYVQGLTNGLPGHQTPIIAVRPDYDYDVDTSATPLLTNFSILDNPAPQNYGVYSPGSNPLLPNAVTLLQSSNIPQVPQNFFSGLTLKRLSGTEIQIGAGAAADSTNSAMLTLSSPCTVNLSNSPGYGALDTGTLAIHTTYFFFIISSPGGGNVNCIASTNQNPSFAYVPSYGLTSYAYTTPSSELVFNAAPTTNAPPPTLSSNLKFNPLAGLLPNDYITGTASQFTSGSQLTSLGPYYQSFTGVATPTTPVNLKILNFPTSPGLYGVVPNMLVGDIGSSGGVITSNTYVTNVCYAVGNCIPALAINCSTGGTPPCVGLSQSTSASVSSDTVYFSGNFNFTVNLPSPVTSSATQNQPVTAQGGLYRLVGALYTVGTMAIPPFVQDGETVYLATPVRDVNTPTSLCGPIGTSRVHCQLSVPCGRNLVCATGLKVEAFGRIIGGPNDLLITSFDQNPSTSSNFSMSPGYSTASSTTTTSFPFRLYTNPNGAVGVQASTATGTDAYEMTDGWVFHPSP